MVKLSIIIPLYNVERYIGKCLDSIFSQKAYEQDYEVIVINDGTPDDSMSVVEKYCNHSNIKIINQSNKGLSGARNRGVNEANGEYIWFVDSDDFIAENSISILLNAIETAHCQVYSFYHKKLFEKDNSWGPEMNGMSEGIVPMKDFSKTSLCVSCAPFYVFNRQFFIDNKLFFHEGVYHEDMEFIAKLKICTDNIYFCPSTLYYYLVRESGSIMTSYNIKKSYDCIVIADELLQFKKTLRNNKKKLSINKSIGFLLVSSLLNVKTYYKSGNKEVDCFVNQMSSVITFRKYIEVLNHSPLSLYLIVCIICIFISPNLFLCLYPKKK